jgi:hypothetical protein
MRQFGVRAGDGPRAKTRVLQSWLLAVLLASPTAGAAPIGTAFSYQGRLADAGNPASGSYDLQFALYDASVGGAQVGPILVRSGVPVANGLFTVALDFGATPFAGNGQWVEIAVRLGSSGAFTTLSPRQELTPTPNALFSAITGDTTVQRRTVAPTCAVGQYVRSLAPDGTPTCAADANSGGTVTSVGSGPGLTGGPLTGAGSLSIATGGVVSGMIANGAVGAAQIDTSQVQTRLAGLCPLGEYLRGVNSNGSVVCGTFSLPPILTTVDEPANQVGNYTSIAIGTDSFPVISYFDSTANSLKVAKCLNVACSGTSTTTTVDDPANSVGQYTSIAIGTDGFPVISYFDSTAAALKVAKCLNAACTGTSTISTVDDPANSVGQYSSIAIGIDGFPVISYQDATAATLKVAKCLNAACTGTSTITIVDNPANNVGYYTSIAIGTDGFPVISYHDNTALSLKVAKCLNAACGGSSTITIVDDPAINVGFQTSIAIGSDGFPVVAYQDSDGTTNALRVAKCANAACTGTSTITIVDHPANHVGYYTSIAIGADSFPVISYHDNTAGTLKVAKCLNAACTGTSTITIVDDPPNAVGHYSSIAIGTDGLPVISYLDQTAGALKVAKCNKPSCAP